jgi:hypothetical protein
MTEMENYRAALTRVKNNILADCPMKQATRFGGLREAVEDIAWIIADDRDGGEELNVQFLAEGQFCRIMVYNPDTRNREELIRWHYGPITLVDSSPNRSPEHDREYTAYHDPFDRMPELACRILQAVCSRNDIIHAVALEFDLPQQGIDELWESCGVVA